MVGPLAGCLRAGETEKWSPRDICPSTWGGPATSLAPPQPQRLSQNALGQDYCLKCGLNFPRTAGDTTPPLHPPPPTLHKSPDSQGFGVTSELKHLQTPALLHGPVQACMCAC